MVSLYRIARLCIFLTRLQIFHMRRQCHSNVFLTLDCIVRCLLQYYYTEVCSAPRLILTLLELDSELIDGLSRRDVFFRLDRNGPWPLPEICKID